MEFRSLDLKDLKLTNHTSKEFKAAKNNFDKWVDSKDSEKTNSTNNLTSKTKVAALAVFSAIVGGASYLAYNGQLKPLASVVATNLSAFAQITLPIALAVGASAIVVILLVKCCMKSGSKEPSSKEPAADTKEPSSKELADETEEPSSKEPAAETEKPGSTCETDETDEREKTTVNEE